MSPEADHQMFSHLLTHSQHNLEDLVTSHQQQQQGAKMPPSYEQSLHHAQSMGAGLPGSGQESHFYTSQQQQQQGPHMRQQSMPSSMAGYNMSPVLSPPQSVQSQHSLSPPNMSSPHLMGHQTSPIKARAMLPTSPTHFAAMRGASHQRIQSFDFPESQQAQQQMGHPGLMYPYLPTPPQSEQHPTTFMTPSPDSPGQWSSASPQSNTDYNEGIHSPPGTFYQQMKPHGQGPEQSAVFI